MQQESEEKESEVNAKSLREILDNLIMSSFDQEKTMQVVRQINSNDPNYIIQSQKQKEIQINLK
jgi:signal transduction histidine kinase